MEGTHRWAWGARGTHLNEVPRNSAVQTHPWQDVKHNQCVRGNWYSLSQALVLEDRQLVRTEIERLGPTDRPGYLNDLLHKALIIIIDHHLGSDMRIQALTVSRE